ncbi:MAG: hypothetical protein KF832_12640 [Caldilineaceae bacterium]|nr:hypothetical protein [Caldilineaceae bacterium]
MSTLIVAPYQPDLPTLESEVAALVRCFYRPILVQGRVTEIDLQHALTGEIQGFWFAGHSSGEGLQLSNTILTPQALAQYLSTAGVTWSFLNSCDSALFVVGLQASYPHDVYASITALEDKTAWRTALLMARNYGNTGNIHTAYRVASPAGTTPLRYFPNPQEGVMSKQEVDQIEELSAQIRELTRVLTGDDRYQQNGLIANVRQLEGRLALIMEEQAKQRMWLLLNSALMVAILGVEVLLRVGG